MVTLNGKDVYLGSFGTPESTAAYDRIIAEWLARGRRPPADAPGNVVTIATLLDAFDAHADGYYRNLDGTPSDERKHYRLATRPLRNLFGALPAAQFGPLALEEVRTAMIESGWCRKVINRQVGRLRSIFDWAVSRELVSPAVLEALRTLDPLRAGKTAAPERDPIRPVPLEHITPVLTRVSRQVRTLIELQLLTGARPGELLVMRGVDLSMLSANATWTYTPQQHKTAYRGHARSIVLGPKAQALLKPFLVNRTTDAYLFSPNEAEWERHRQQRAERRTPVQPSQVARAERSARRRRRRAPADRYDVASYRRAIARACEDSSIATWSPHRLRHNAGTHIRQRYGLDAARLILGHRSTQVTEIYAEQDVFKAVKIMGEIG